MDVTVRALLQDYQNGPASHVYGAVVLHYV